MLRWEIDMDFAVKLATMKFAAILRAVRQGESALAVKDVVGEVSRVGGAVVEDNAAVAFTDFVLEVATIEGTVFKLHDPAAIDAIAPLAFCPIAVCKDYVSAAIILAIFEFAFIYGARRQIKSSLPAGFAGNKRAFIAVAVGKEHRTLAILAVTANASTCQNFVCCVFGGIGLQQGAAVNQRQGESKEKKFFRFLLHFLKALHAKGYANIYCRMLFLA